MVKSFLSYAYKILIRLLLSFNIELFYKHFIFYILAYVILNKLLV